jgi:hypothetical protein
VTTYSTQLFAGELTAAEQVFVAPSSFTTVVRDIELWNASSGPEDIAVNLLGVSGLYVAGLVTAFAMKANGTFQWEGRVVMIPGQRLFVAATAYPVGIVVSGYELSN